MGVHRGDRGEGSPTWAVCAELSFAPLAPTKPTTKALCQTTPPPPPVPVVRHDVLFSVSNTVFVFRFNQV